MSLGPVGGGWVIGVADLVALTGAFLYPVAQMWSLAEEVTESQRGPRRRTTTSTATSDLAWEVPEDEDAWLEEMEDAGFFTGAGPVMREELRVEELKRWEIRERRLVAMTTRRPEEIAKIVLEDAVGHRDREHEAAMMWYFGKRRMRQNKKEAEKNLAITVAKYEELQVRVFNSKLTGGGG